jgi:hypothetical protein
MPVRDWPKEDDDGAGNADAAQHMEQMDPTEKMRRARLLLRDLLAAARQLGDALVRAGLSPSLWRDPDTRLSDLDRQAPSITLDALLTRLTELAAETGPTLLSGGGDALDDFEREVRDLSDVVRPLRALAQRERLKPRAARDPKALSQALSDVPVGVALDRVNRALRELDTLAPRLRPLSAEQWQALEAALAAAAAPNAPTTMPARGQPSRAFSPAAAVPDAAATVPSAYAGIPDEAPSDPDAPTYLSSGWLPDARPNDPTVPFGPRTPPGQRTGATLWLGQRPRTWGLVLATALLLLAGTATLTLLAQHALFSLSATTTATLTSAQSTLAAGHLAHAPTATVTPQPTPTRIPPTATPSGPARLTASPTSLTLPCPGAGAATLTLSNTGGRAAAWTASVSTGASVSPRSGTLQPGDSADLSVASLGATRGTVTIRWSGGSTKVAFHVSC